MTIPDITITQVFDFVGTVAFAISGIRLASAKRFDLFGAYVVGVTTAIGGGTMRDLMLGLTPFWLTNPDLLRLCPSVGDCIQKAFGETKQYMVLV